LEKTLYFTHLCGFPHFKDNSKLERHKNKLRPRFTAIETSGTS